VNISRGSYSDFFNSSSIEILRCFSESIIELDLKEIKLEDDLKALEVKII